jgi:hypothetical protein
MGDACRHCGGSPDGRKLEQPAWDGGLVSLHQGCIEQWVGAQDDGMDLPDFLDRRNLNRGAA